MRFHRINFDELPLGNPFEPNIPGGRLHSTSVDPIVSFAALENAQLTQLGLTLNSIGTGVANLDTMIQNFQNSVGTLSQADQTALTAIVASSTALNTQASGINVTPPAGTTPIPPVVPTPTPAP